MTLELEIQNECPEVTAPDADDFRRWVAAVIQDRNADITLRIVNKEDSAYVNKTYRQKKGPTNILSFPYEMDADDILHGDILLCAPIVHEEAEEIGIPVLSHWAHLTIHGCYHILGYDHQSKKDAEEMEALEINTLSSLGFDNPYDTIDKIDD